MVDVLALQKYRTVLIYPYYNCLDLFFMTGKAWENYEEVATYLLDRNARELGLDRVESKQKVRGSATKWEIDAKGVKDDETGFVVIEYRRHTTSRLNQKELGAFAYVINDIKASGGIIVSPLQLQSGAKKIASFDNILEVTLDADSTPQEFAMRFLNNLMLGKRSTVSFSDEIAITKNPGQKSEKKFLYRDR